MKLLVLTQKVDKDETVLGFFHNWLLKLASKFESVIVVCLEKGQYNLPNNVQVLSLGKEVKSPRGAYIFNFYKYIWQQRKNYDAVFCHMNQEYILLGGLFWRLLGKKISLWRNHRQGNFWTRIAVAFSHIVFCTSNESFTKRFKRTKVMPVGIDTDIFVNKNIARLPKSVLFLSRIAPVKNPDILVGALCLLKKRGIDFQASFVGDPLPKDKGLYEKLKKQAASCGLDDNIKWLPAVPNWQTSEVYNKFEIFVNLTSPGSFDKTIFEAMACGSLIVSSNPSLADILPKEFACSYRDSQSLADSLSKVLSIEDKAKYGEDFRKYVLENHSLSLLADKIKINLQNL